MSIPSQIFRRLQLRRDTSANWTAANPILRSGEAGIDDTGSDVKIKIGDGTSNWNDLDYLYIVGGGGIGDMLKSDNLSGLTNYATARSNLGLGNVNNTADLDKPISTTTQSALNAKQDTLTGLTASVAELNYTDGVTSAIQTQLDGKVDENASITGATKTKITYDAKGLVTAGADATTADIADSSNKRYVTDAQQTIIAATQESFTTVHKGKLDNITVTQVVDLDTIESRVNELDASVILKGSWDASVGTFPGAGVAQAGWSYIVSTGGTVDGQVFTANDRIVAIIDNASTTTYATNWLKLDYTDAVLSVVGLTGAVSKANLLTAINVEDGADVTDTANVTSAGALMDSEVTSLSGIKTLTVPDNTTISTAAKSVLDDTTVGDMVNTLGGATSTGTGGLVRTGSPALTTPSIAAITVSGGVLTLPTGATDTLVGKLTTDTFSTGVKTFLNGILALRNVANTFSAFFTNTITANRTYTLQDRNGTLADDTDLAAKAALAGSTTQAFSVSTLDVGNADTTISRVSAGVIAVEGNNVVTNTSSPTLATVTTTGNIELGNASDTTLSRSAAGTLAVEGVRVQTTTPLVVSATSYTTDTGTSLNMDNLDMFIVTAQAGALLFNAPGGTLVQGRTLIIRIKDNGTARALTWNAVFRAMGVALPTTTVLSKTLYLGFIYNSTDTKWDLVASAQEA